MSRRNPEIDCACVVPDSILTEASSSLLMRQAAGAHLMIGSDEQCGELDTAVRVRVSSLLPLAGTVAYAFSRLL